MKMRNWLNRLKSPSPNRQSKRAQVNFRQKKAVCVLTVTSLEDRTVPTFATPAPYAAGVSPYAVVAADFNNDTVLDLATANNSDSTVSVLLGNGDGTFQPAVPSTTGANPQSLAVGDFNDDGNMDLATANYGDVSVLLGDGTGAFAPAAGSGYGVYGNPQSVAVGDFNGDGTLDLGVTSSVYTPGYYGGWYGYTWYPGYNTAYANVLVGNGDGSFSGPNATFIDYYASANSALATDINGDTYDDFVTFDTNGYVAVLTGDSSGYLQGPGYFYTGDYSHAVASGDLNGDGNNDLVTSNYYGNSVGVLLGDGAGGFSGPTTYDAGGYPFSIVLGDFTHDGNLDVATSNYYSDQVSVLYGDGDGALSTPTLAATGSAPYSIVAGYFDGDTWLDAATANLGDNTVSALINDTVWPPPPPPPPPIVSIADASLTEGNTGTTEMTFTVSLSALYNQDVTVQYATADAGSATAGSDYANTFGEVTIPRGQWSSTFTVTIAGDRLAEPTEYFHVNLSAPVNATLGDDQGVGYIYDDEPMISIGDVSITEGNTGSANASFTVYLSQASDVDVKVHYATANVSGGATAGSDYTATSGDLTIPHGQSSKTFTVAITGDRVPESNETFVVNLTAPENAGITDDQAIGTIVDNEPRVSINDVAIKEGNGKSIQMIFTVRLAAAYDETVKVGFATSSVGGTATADVDYQSKNGTLTFAAGVTSMTVSITILADKTKESNETFFVNLSGGTSNYFLFDSQGVGTIQDDDTHGKK